MIQYNCLITIINYYFHTESINRLLLLGYFFILIYFLESDYDTCIIINDKCLQGTQIKQVDYDMTNGEQAGNNAGV